MRLHRWSEISARSRAKPGAAETIQRYKSELLGELTLAELRRARDFTQVRLAEVMEKPQSAISRIERETDLYVSTLRSYIEAMGGRLEMKAVFPDGEVTITSFGELADETQEGVAQIRDEPAPSPGQAGAKSTSGPVSSRQDTGSVLGHEPREAALRERQEPYRPGDHTRSRPPARPE